MAQAPATSPLVVGPASGDPASPDRSRAPGREKLMGPSYGARQSLLKQSLCRRERIELGRLDSSGEFVQTGIQRVEPTLDGRQGQGLDLTSGASHAAPLEFAARGQELPVLADLGDDLVDS